MSYWKARERTQRVLHPEIAAEQRLRLQKPETRGVKVGRFVKFLYGGLNEHVEHHLFPAVPSRNLTGLHKTLDYSIPERQIVTKCWQEILAIARNGEKQPADECVPRM